MALLSRAAKNIVDRAQSEDWRDAEQMGQVLQALTQQAKAIDVVGLVFHRVPQVRQAALQVFQHSADAKAAAKLLEAIGEQRAAQAKTFGLQLLARLPADLTGPAIEHGLRSKQAARQLVAWQAALQLPGDAGRFFSERALKEAPPPIRQHALETLLSTAPAAQLKGRLLELLDEELPGALQARVLQALGSLDDPEVFQAMIGCFEQGAGAARDLASAYLRKYAQAHPQQVREPMMMALAGGDDSSRHLALEVLFGSGTAAEVLAQVLVAARGMAPWLRNRLIQALKQLGDRVLLPAVALVNHPEEDVRNAALALAEEFRDPRLVEPLCRLLTHEDWWLRIAACDALRRLGDRRAVPALLLALQDEDARWAAIDALATLGAPEALQPLGQMTQDPRAEVRLEAVQALARFNDPRVATLIRQMAERDPVLEVRTRAKELVNQQGAGLPVVSGEGAPILERGEGPLDQLLIRVREEGASDVHLTPGEPPMVRRAGELTRLDTTHVTAEQVEQLLRPLLKPHQEALLAKRGDLDFCHAIPEVGRYRANLYQTRLGLNACFRVIPNLPPTFAQLRLPEALVEITTYHQGLLLVTGPAGSGKSTTLAALINVLNEAKPVHIITLEDPVEFVHPSKTALVHQREMGSHSASFARALRGALRQDPDVIMVGELRDAETTRMSLEAAETGHLVIATMSTNSATATIDRLIGSFPAEEQGQVQMAVSESLKWIISQSLLPRADGAGRVALFEVLKGTVPVANCIREGKTLTLPGIMQTGRELGMRTVDGALEDLVQQGLVKPEDAYVRAEQPATFEPLCSAEFLNSLQV